MVDSETFDYQELDPRKFDAGHTYTREQLPENEMDPVGRPEWVSDDTIAVLSDGTMLEFRRAYECTAVYEITDDGDVGEVYSGEPR